MRLTWLTLGESLCAGLLRREGSWYRTMFVSSAGLDAAKKLVSSYKQSQIPLMTPELWSAKKVVDSTLHPGLLRPRSSHNLVLIVWQTPESLSSFRSACPAIFSPTWLSRRAC